VGNPDLAWTCPPAVDLPWLLGLEMTVEEPKPWVGPSTCPGPSLLSWFGLEMVVEEPNPCVDPSMYHGPSLASWLGDGGGGNQTLHRPVHMR